MRKDDQVDATRWRVANCETTLARLRESQDRISAFRDSAMKTYLSSLNAQSISAVERSLRVLKEQLQKQSAMLPARPLDFVRRGGLLAE